MPAQETPTGQLRRREVQRFNNMLDKAELSVVRNSDYLSWLTPWLQQDLLVPVVDPDGDS